jgi:mannitol/fructose-specific phosphotransferase system IIA component (Ntr-type)
MRSLEKMSTLAANLRLEEKLKSREQKIRELNRELQENQMLEDKYQAELALEREEFYKALQKAQE